MPTPAPTEPPEQESEREVPLELRLDLPSFQGPMDLLLELVRDREIEIYEVPISEITNEYLTCIDRMEELDLEVGGDWLQMAARLMYIKSRTLLPDEDEEEEDDGPNPREELLRQLVEYERVKKLSEKLDGRPQLGEDTFRSEPRLERYRQQSGPPAVREAEVSDLIAAIRRLVDQSEEGEGFVYEMTREKLSLRAVVLEIADRLEANPRVTFDSLFGAVAPSRNRIVTTFVALLEMTRLDMINLFQSKLGEAEQLYIERAVIDIVEVSQSLDLADEGSEVADVDPDE